MNRIATARNFINAVYRRMLIVRAAEQFGLGLLVASMLAVILLSVAVWQSLPIAPIVYSCGGFGLLVGMLLAIRNRATFELAVIETDRQLQLQELLVTVMAPSVCADPEFTALLQSMADARCAVHLPSEVLLRRLGVRSWSGIVLVMCIAAMLAVIPLGAARSQAVDSNASILSAGTSDRSIALKQENGFTSPANNPLSESASSNSMTNDAPADHALPGEDAAPSHDSQNSTKTGSGGGSGASESSTKTNVPGLQAPGRASDSNGITAGGGSLADRTAREDSNHSISASDSTQGASGKTTGEIPAWDGQGTPPSAKGQAFFLNQIPLEHRDLVRAFFDARSN